MGKTVMAVVGVVAAIGIAIVAPYLAPLALGALGITATATALAIATAVIATTLSVGLSLAFRALGVGAPSAKNAVGPPQVFRQSISNSFIALGKRRVGGLMVFFHARKAGDNYFRYFVVAVAGHRCKGVVTWMLGDQVVTVDGAGKVTSGKYANAAWLWFRRGLASETANSTFVAECGGKWTTAHKGNGVASIYAKFEMTDQVVEAGMPNITAIIEGRDEIRDSRDGATKYTANAALVFNDWMKMPREEGGFGAYTDEIPDDAWVSAQANVCDETVGGGPRYEINGVITTGAAPSEIRDVMVVNCAGSYTYTGGKHVMRPGYWVPSSVSLEEDDLAGPIQVSPFVSADAAANEVNGTYISPTDNYQAAPFATQTLSPSPTDIKQLDLDLAFTTSKSQAERIARIMLLRANAEKTVVWPMNISGLKVKALDTVQLATARYSLSNYAWTVVGWSMSPDWGVVLNLREEDAAIYTAPTVVAAPTAPVIEPAEPVIRRTFTTVAASEAAMLALESRRQGDFAIRTDVGQTFVHNGGTTGTTTDWSEFSAEPTTFTVASQAAQLALPARRGDVAVRTDLNQSFVHNGGQTGTISDWTRLLTPTSVDSATTAGSATTATNVGGTWTSTAIGNLETRIAALENPPPP